MYLTEHHRSSVIISGLKLDKQIHKKKNNEMKVNKCVSKESYLVPNKLLNSNIAYGFPFNLTLSMRV